MTKTLIIFFFLIPTLLFPQKKKTKKKEKDSQNFWTIGVLGGSNIYNANPKICSQTNFIGLDCSFHVNADPRHYGIHRFDTRYILPTASKVNDSISYSFNSFSGSYSLGRDLITKKHFRLPFLLGFTCGQTNLKTNNNHTYKNNILAPKASIQTCFMFSRVICTLGFEYSYDVSHSIWSPKIDSPLITNFNQTCMTAYFSLAFRLSKQ